MKDHPLKNTFCAKLEYRDQFVRDTSISGNSTVIIVFLIAMHLQTCIFYL
jgi:hypothetical protein